MSKRHALTSGTTYKVSVTACERGDTFVACMCFLNLSTWAVSCAFDEFERSNDLKDFVKVWRILVCTHTHTHTLLLEGSR